MLSARCGTTKANMAPVCKYNTARAWPVRHSVFASKPARVFPLHNVQTRARRKRRGRLRSGLGRGGDCGVAWANAPVANASAEIDTAIIRKRLEFSAVDPRSHG